MNIEPLYSTRLSLKIVQINYNVCFKKIRNIATMKIIFNIILRQQSEVVCASLEYYLFLLVPML